MSQPDKRVQLPLFGMIFLGLLTGIYLAISRLFTKKATPTQKISRHTVKKPAADALQYWTADKMHSTRGMDLPKVDVPGNKQTQQSSPYQD
jgi:hypothetical protein